jgi:hypothetical protein
MLKYKKLLLKAGEKRMNFTNFFRKEKNIVKTWHFNNTDICSNFKFNQSMTEFDKYGIAGVIRENIQNSCDARLNNIDPVKINIELERIDTKELPGINCLKKRIKVLEGKNQYSKETIANMQAVIEQEKCNIMTVEDSNTKGLTGATKSNSPYTAYAYSKGFHAEEKDAEKEAQRGGSHGIGKIASNAASDIATMYFTTKDDLGEMYIGGTCEFIDHSYEDKNYLGTGYFANFKLNKFEAYKNEEVNKIFSKDTRGLKVIIPFVKEEFFNSKEAIIKSICDSFFIGILNNDLEVKVSNEKIDAINLEKVILNKQYYEQDVREYKRNSNLTPLYFKTFKTQNKIELTVSDKNKEIYSFDAYFNMVDDLKVGRYCIFRTNGMRIAEKSIKGYASSNFNVVLVSKSTKEDTFLKSLENEAHTQLSSEHIKDKDIKSNAVRFLNELDNKIAEIVAKKIEELNPTDGKIDTSDLIYEMEYTFKKIEKETKSTIKIAEKTPKEEEVVVTKTSTGNFKINSDGNMVKKSSPTSSPEKRKVTKKVNGKEKKLIKLSSGVVKRKFFQDKEKLLLNLSGIDELKRCTRCSLKISAIDGEGKEIDDFLISDNYKNFRENDRVLNLSEDKSEIEDITIKNNRINLILDLSENCNKNLKFTYEVVI